MEATMKNLTTILITYLIVLLFPGFSLAQGPVESVCTGGLRPTRWQEIGKLPQKRTRFATFQAGGRVFVFGGTNGLTPVTDSWSAAGTGQLNEWAITTPMSVTVSGPAAAVLDKRIFVLGGYAAGYDARSVNVTQVLDVSLDQWQSARPMNNERVGAYAFVANGHLYVVSGDENTTVEYATIQANGDLGEWKFGPTPTISRHSAAVAATSDYVYIIGGQSPLTYEIRDSVEMARINTDGNLTNWQVLSSKMNLRRAGFQAAIANGYLYALGGSTYQGNPSIPTYDLVERAKINKDGTLSSWQFVSQMTTPRREFSAIVVGDSLYALGGVTDQYTVLDSFEAIDISAPPPPADYGLTINDGSLFTNQVSVTLTIGDIAPWIDQVQVSNDGGFAGATWQPYSTCKNWTITQYGNYIIPRVVYVRYKDSNNVIHGPFSDDIILDMTAPTGGVTVGDLTTGSIQTARVSKSEIEAQANHTIYLPLIFKTGPAPNVTLTLTASDDVSGVGFMQISNRADFSDNGWEPYNSNPSWYLPNGATVYVRFRDYAGNISKVYSAKR
jgi:hypothetical protein